METPADQERGISEVPFQSPSLLNINIPADQEKGLTEVPAEDPFLVTFNQPIDHENPQDWARLRKWTVTGVLSATGFNRIMVSTIMAPALMTIGSELHMNSIEQVMSMSVYLLATAFGPLLAGPLSEMYGRAPVLHATNIWFLVWNIVCGFAETKELLIIARFLAGFGASAIYALAGGVLGDIWPPSQRGSSLGFYILIPLLGVAIGPIIGGLISQYTTWRWIFWSTSIIQGVMIAFSFLMFRETHSATILASRAKHFQKTTGNPQYYTAVEKLDVGKSKASVILNHLSRPVRLLMFHPIIQIQACLSGFSYGILYLVLSTFADLYTRQYNESMQISGLHYISICLGEVVGAIVGGPLIDYFYRRLGDRAEGVAVPEFRVPMMVPGYLLASVGLLIYGWAAEKHLQWIVVDVGVFVLCFAMQVGGTALQAYVIDTYPNHASSASASTQFLKSMTAFGFPLFAPNMYSVLGYGWGNSLLAFAGLAIGIPAPLLIWNYGARLRARMQSSH